MLLENGYHALPRAPLTPPVVLPLCSTVLLNVVVAVSARVFLKTVAMVTLADIHSSWEVRACIESYISVHVYMDVGDDKVWCRLGQTIQFAKVYLTSRRLYDHNRLATLRREAIHQCEVLKRVLHHVQYKLTEVERNCFDWQCVNDHFM